MPKTAGRREVDVVIKGRQEGSCGFGTFPYLDCGGGYTNARV